MAETHAVEHAQLWKAGSVNTVLGAALGKGGTGHIHLKHTKTEKTEDREGQEDG